MNPTGPSFRFDQRRRLHILVSAIGEDIEAALDTGCAHRGEDLVLVGKLSVVAAMIRQQHVHNGTCDKNNNGRKQDREPKSGERNHLQPP